VPNSLTLPRGKGTIRVFARVRPLLPSDFRPLPAAGDKGTGAAKGKGGEAPLSAPSAAAVTCAVRTPLDGDGDPRKVIVDVPTASSCSSSGSSSGPASGKGGGEGGGGGGATAEASFRFDRVFGTASTQSDVFLEVRRRSHAGASRTNGSPTALQRTPL
jgi:hypothetical protein